MAREKNKTESDPDPAVLAFAILMAAVRAGDYATAAAAQETLDHRHGVHVTTSPTKKLKGVAHAR